MASLAAITGESTERRGRAVLLRWIERRRFCADDAEDLLHGAFVRMVQYRSDMPVRDPTGFLLRTAANLAVDQHRGRRHLAAGPVESLCAGFADPAPPADELLAARDRLRRVQQGLDTIGGRSRAIFLLHRVEGCKQREIAVQFGISHSAVEKHIARTARFLDRWMEGWGA